jgi:DNA-directed RNA polymerase subunit RPC12/RpoP
MADQLSNYKCPNCGGPLRFDPKEQKLKCEYCDSLFTQEEVEQFYRPSEIAAAAEGTDTRWETDTNEWSSEEAAHLRAYNCPSCGAQLIADENTAVTVCPYCNNPTVVAGQFVSKKPQFVLPFQLDKDKAVEILTEFYKGKPLLPHAFKSHNHIQEVKGVYVPFWLYNGVMDADMTFRAERVAQFTRGDEIITETSHYNIVRSGTVTFSGVPADASSKMPDEYMDAIEPFDFTKLKDFDTMYLAGYMADSYDVDEIKDRERADRRMNASTTAAISSTVVGYTGVVPISTRIQRVDGAAAYAFLPVWLLSTQWNGKNYLFAVNGQSGKIVGDMPTDTSLLIRYWLIITMTLFVIAAIVLYFMGGGFL